jgi:hypothetical protein
MADRLFDTGIFDSGIFKTEEPIPGIFDTGIFDTGIFDHPSVGVTLAADAPEPPRYGGGAPIWSEVSWFRKKKKPKKEDLIEEVAEIVEQAVPAVTEQESRVVALRLVNQIPYAQLRQIQSLEAFIARVEAELAEMDDEEVLLLAA